MRGAKGLPVQHLLGRVDHVVDPLVHWLQPSIRDDHSNLNDNVLRIVQPSHFAVDLEASADTSRFRREVQKTVDEGLQEGKGVPRRAAHRHTLMAYALLPSLRLALSTCRGVEWWRRRRKAEGWSLEISERGGPPPLWRFITVLVNQRSLYAVEMHAANVFATKDGKAVRALSFMSNLPVTICERSPYCAPRPAPPPPLPMNC